MGRRLLCKCGHQKSDHYKYQANRIIKMTFCQWAECSCEMFEFENKELIYRKASHYPQHINDNNYGRISTTYKPKTHREDLLMSRLGPDGKPRQGREL